MIPVTLNFFCLCKKGEESVIVEGVDTLKFHTKTSAGEKYDDCESIFFKIGGYSYLVDTLQLQSQLNDSMKSIIYFNLHDAKNNPYVV